MSVFVTEIIQARKTRFWHWTQKAYLFADTRCELHDFAHSIGLHPYTFVNQPHFPCYPITVCKRYKALDCGALPMSTDEVIKFQQQSTLSCEVQDGN